MTDASLDEFRTIGEGFCWEKPYVRASDTDGQATSLGLAKVNVPKWVAAKLEELVESHAYKGYRTSADVIRDAIAQTVFRRLKELPGMEHQNSADEWGQWFERDRLEIIGKMHPDAVEDWNRQFKTERNPERLTYLLIVAKEQAKSWPKFWRDELDEVCKKYER